MTDHTPSPQPQETNTQDGKQCFYEGPCGWAAERDDRRAEVAPLLRTRFKLSFNKAGNCTVFRKDQAEELDGQWVWLIDASDGGNSPLYSQATIDTLTADRDRLKARVAELTVELRECRHSHREVLNSLAVKNKQIVALQAQLAGRVEGMPSREQMLESALTAAVETIQDYLAYTHDGDPWSEDSRTMGEMDINDYGRDGRLDYALSLLAARQALKGEQA